MTFPDFLLVRVLQEVFRSQPCRLKRSRMVGSVSRCDLGEITARSRAKTENGSSILAAPSPILLLCVHQRFADSLHVFSHSSGTKRRREEGKGAKQERNAKKRKLSPEKEKKHQSPQPPAPKEEAKPAQPVFDEKDVHCIVCFDLPPKDILQCKNGHLMCHMCYAKIVEGVKSICPSCREPLSR